MTTTISKRQQARNERVLQELVSTVPGNNFCADCNAPNPSWASWSLGVFLCMRCGAIHRKLGTHISKVKSLSMDTWTAEQVENMRKVGNRASNKIYNPNNLKPSIPIDADEADSAMERFIRQKYINSNASSQIKGTTRLEEDSPPPLPPKGLSKFGMRSASSIFPLGSKKKQVPAQSPIPSPRLDNKPSKVFGASVNGFDSSTEDMERKLAKLRDMGFIDNQRNTVVLKCVNGNLDRAVEALVRLGEGNSRGGLRPSRSLTPLSPSTPSRMGFSLNVEQPQTPASTTSSNNPFDALPAPPQSSQSTGTIQNKNPYSNGTNPFGQPQGLSDFDQAFTNMTIAPTRPLFPNHTGGTTGQGVASMTGLYATNVPPVPPTPSQFLGTSYEQSGTYSQPATSLNSQNTGYSLFFQQTSPAVQQSATFPQQPQMQNQQAAFQMQFQQQQQQTQQKGLPISTHQHTAVNNPFMRSPTRIQSPALSQIPESQQPTSYTGQQPVASPTPVSTNPFFTAPAQSTAQPAQMAPRPAGMFQPVHSQTIPYGQQMLIGSSAQSQTLQVQQQQQPQQPQLQQQQQFQPQYMPKPSKENILALYNYPQLAPQPTGMPNAIPPAQPAQTQHMQVPSQQIRSFSTPVHGSKNPFASINTAAPNQIQMAAAVPNSTQMSSRPAGSRESIALRGEMAWNNGRHSPDAFAALSSRQ